MWSLARRALSRGPVLPRWTRSMAVLNVPAMGDSITEGTLLSIEKPVGQAIKADEVLATLETDKVTVDVRAKTGGVVTQFFAQIGDTVRVGAPLADIDESGSAAPAPATPAAKATAPAPAAPATKAAAPAAAAPAAAAPAHEDHGRARKPLIHFRHGKANKAAHSHGASHTHAHPSLVSVARSAPTVAAAPLPSSATLTLLDLPVFFGRPVLSTAEIDAINTGGRVAGVDDVVPAAKKPGKGGK